MSAVYSWGEVVIVTQEDSYLVRKKPVGTDAITIVESSMDEGGNERRTREDKVDTRSVRGVIQGRRSGSWSLRKYALGSGAAGTAPDDGTLWKSVFGAETVTPATSVAYSLAKRTESLTMQVERHVEGDVSQVAMGAIPNQSEIAFSGVDECRLTFSGDCAYLLWTGVDTVSSISGQDVTVSNAYNFRVGSVIQVGDDDNGGTGYLVTARNVSTNVLTVGGPGAPSAGNGDVVKPFLPTTTVCSTEPVFGTVGSFSLGGVTNLAMRTATFRVNNNAGMRNDVYGQEFATAMTLTDLREVAADFSIWADLNIWKFLGFAESRVAKAISCVSGATAGNILTVAATEAILEIPNVEMPGRGEVAVTLPARIVDSSGAEGEITATWT